VTGGRWLLKGALSLGYWLLAARLLIGLFMGDAVDGGGDAGPWPARLTLLGAVALWAGLSVLYDRALDRRR